MQLLGSDVTLPIFEQEPRQSQALACWPEIHRPQALQHVRWGRHRIHITNIGRVMAEINNYVAAGGCRSVDAPSPHPGFPAPRWIIEKRAGKGQDAQPTHLPGLCPDLRTATLPMWNVTYRSWLTLSGVSVTGSPTWRPACPLSHLTKPRRAACCLQRLIRFETSCRGDQNGRRSRSRSETWGMLV
jgi:hypothetical protein